jgi:hypothetical protein
MSLRDAWNQSSTVYTCRFGSSHLLHPVVCCANSPVFGKKFRAPQDLRRRGLGQTHENRKDVWNVLLIPSLPPLSLHFGIWLIRSQSVCSFFSICFFCFLYSVIWSDFCSSQFFDLKFCAASIVCSMMRYPCFVSLNLFIYILKVINENFMATGFILSVQEVVVEYHICAPQRHRHLFLNWVAHSLRNALIYLERTPKLLSGVKLELPRHQTPCSITFHSPHLSHFTTSLSRLYPKLAICTGPSHITANPTHPFSII